MAGFDDRLVKRFFGIHGSEHPRPIPNDLPVWLSKLWLLTMGTAMPLALAWSPGFTGWFALGLILAIAIMICLKFRGALLEWSVIVSTAYVLVVLTIPPVTPDHSWQKLKPGQIWKGAKNPVQKTFAPLR